ncbi:hypothetical protein F2Q70_00004020 [Brassica cretica]|uniref:Uncharacterized protein n=1 Tax=Brassica cretica TaxID=69181 RepID=A0A3N6QUD1_BRACR|nr:hypothetical protein F2Q70_00004020 [Brassica cretica]KAF3566727.1 hypothetical protein DY000_02015960 [Brassica cretica]
MKQARSSAEAGGRVVRQHAIKQRENGDVPPKNAYLMGEKSMMWCTSRGGRKAHLDKRGRLKMQDVCPEVVADVVADAANMLSGEDHVESRC